jgi:hypothetical protein
MAGGQPTFGDYARAGLGGATDMATILAHGITFGLNDKIVHALTGADAEGAYDAARARTGLVGDIGSVAGLAGGAKAALSGVKALPAIAKAVVSKKGLGLGLGGLATLAEYNARTGDETPVPKVAAAAAVAKPAVKEAVAHAAAAEGVPTNDFSAMIQRLANGQGGAISLRQLGALSDAAQKGSQADYYARGGSAKAPAPGDLAGHMLEQQYVAQFQNALQDPKADPAKAQQQFEDKVLQLRKTQFNDPYGLRD